jgi:hypothetical protein
MTRESAADVTRTDDPDIHVHSSLMIRDNTASAFPIRLITWTEQSMATPAHAFMTRENIAW